MKIVVQWIDPDWITRIDTDALKAPYREFEEALTRMAAMGIGEELTLSVDTTAGTVTIQRPPYSVSGA